MTPLSYKQLVSFSNYTCIVQTQMSVCIHKFPLGLALSNLNTFSSSTNFSIEILKSNHTTLLHPKPIMTAPTEKPSKLNRLLRSPLQALVRLRDSYIRGMTGCADLCQAGGVSFGHLHPLPSTQGVARSNRFGSNAMSSRGDNKLLQQLIRAKEMRRARSLELGREEAVKRSRRGLMRIKLVFLMGMLGLRGAGVLLLEERGELRASKLDL